MKSKLILLATVTLLYPGVSSGQDRLSEEQLKQLAIERETCGDRAVVSAAYDEEVANRVVVTCGEDAEGFVPLAAGLGGAGAAAAGLALVALAGGGGDSTPSTSSTGN